MIGRELSEIVCRLLGDPGSDEYRAARDVLNERPTLWEAVQATAVVADMEPIKQAEARWVFTTMPAQVADKILQRVRVALNAGVPVLVTWTEGIWHATADVADHADGTHLHISTPIPDLSKLASGAWFGSSLVGTK